MCFDEDLAILYNKNKCFEVNTDELRNQSIEYFILLNWIAYDVIFKFSVFQLLTFHETSVKEHRLDFYRTK